MTMDDEIEPGSFDGEDLMPRGAMLAYVSCGMWVEDLDADTGEWFVRDIYDVDDGCMALLERAGCEPITMHTGELRKSWRLTRDFDPDSEVTW